MSGQVKIKLRENGREIELEGARADVDALLQQWWVAAPAAPAAPRSQAKQTTRKRSSKAAGAPAEPNGDDDSKFDPVTAANAIREHEHHGLMMSKVLHQKNVWNKVALALWCNDEPLTSGDVHRTLRNLDVNLSLPNVSDRLKEHSSKLIKSGTRKRGGAVVRYKMTGQARKEFGEWLLKPEEAKKS